MGRTFKIIGGIVAVVIIAVVAVFVYVYSNLDSIVKDAVEEHGPRYTGVSVKLEKVELSPENGEGKLSGLIVGNPPGYGTESAFKLGSISVSIDLASLTSDTIIIKSIVIDQPDVTYEFGEGGSNISVIGQNVEKAAGPPGQETPTEKSETDKKMIVESLVVSNGRVSVSHPMLKGQKAGAGLPTIRLKDIGKDKKDGATPAEVVDKVMDAVEQQIAVAVRSSNLDDMLKRLDPGAADAIKNLEGGADGAAKGAGDTLKKLFGK